LLNGSKFYNYIHHFFFFSICITFFKVFLSEEPTPIEFSSVQKSETTRYGVGPRNS